MKRFLTSKSVWALALLLFTPLTLRAQVSPGDTDRDLDTDLVDFKKLVDCATGPGGTVSPDCDVANIDRIGGVDLLDFAILQRGFSPWSRITEMSPASAEDMVALTRETIITIPNGVQAATVSNDNVFATFGGNNLSLLNGAPRVTPDGKRIKLFYDPPLPPEARIRVTIDGSGIMDVKGFAVDADNDGVPGGARTFDFDTCTTACIPNTTVFGFVFASKLRGPMGEDLPLVGVTLCVEGIPDLCAVTDATGRFELGVAPLQNCPLGGIPAPEFIVHINGKTVTAVGTAPFDRITNGGFYPTITKTFRSNPGHTVQIMQDNAAFDIYLPFVADDVNDPTLVSVNPNAMTEITLSDAGKTRFCELFPVECAANPNAADALKLMIPPGSFNNDDGSPGNMAGIFPVDSTRLPAPLPGGQVHTMDITIQSDGATNFDLPTPIRFPNVPDADGNRLRPGEKTGLVSFNHDTGEWELRGSMTAGSDDDGEDSPKLFVLMKALASRRLAGTEGHQVEARKVAAVEAVEEGLRMPLRRAVLVRDSRAQSEQCGAWAAWQGRSPPAIRLRGLLLQGSLVRVRPLVVQALGARKLFALARPRAILPRRPVAAPRRAHGAS